MRSMFKRILAAVLFAVPIVTAPAPENHTAYALEYKLIRSMDKDTTGDGIKEKISIFADEENKGYIVEILHGEKKTFRLKPAEKFKYIAGYTPFYDLNMIAADINKDSVPEIITWGSGTHEVPFHVFRWDGSDYRLELSGWTYSSLSLEDITRDDTLEIVIENRLYGLGYESIFYGWKNGRYEKVHYKLDAARGFDRIKLILQMLNMQPASDPILFNEKIPDRIRFLKKYFTDEWIRNEENIKHLKKLSENLLFIEITELLASDIAKGLQSGDPDRELWRFKVRTFKTHDSHIETRDYIMEVVTVFTKGPVDVPSEDRWRIDSIEFTR